MSHLLIINYITFFFHMINIISIASMQCIFLNDCESLCSIYYPKSVLFVNVLARYRCPITLSLDYVTMVLLATVWQANSNSDACNYDRIMRLLVGASKLTCAMFLSAFTAITIDGISTKQDKSVFLHFGFYILIKKAFVIH